MFDLIASKLSSYLKVKKEEITMATDIKKDLKADSLTVIELLYDLEQELRIQIPDDVVAGLETVGDVVRYVEKIKK